MGRIDPLMGSQSLPILGDFAPILGSSDRNKIVVGDLPNVVSEIFVLTMQQ